MTNALIFIRPLEASNVDSTKGDGEEYSEEVTVWRDSFFNRAIIPRVIPMTSMAAI